MTTITDYARDLVLETQKRLIDKNEKLDKDRIDIPDIYKFNAEPLTDEEIKDLTLDFIEIIKNRIIG